MSNHEALTLGVDLLAAGGSFVAATHQGVVARGFTDLRPAQVFAFARLAEGGATVRELAAYLGVTSQAVSQFVDEIVDKGYAQRRPHPDDARARLVVLTEQGHTCARAAQAAAEEVTDRWASALGEERLRALREDLRRLAPANGSVCRPW